MPHEPEPDLRGARVHDPDFARLPVSAVRTSGGGMGTRWGFLPRWQLEAAYGSSSGLFLITMVNVLVVSAAVVYYFGGPRLVDDESRGRKLTRNLSILYLLLGLPWAALGAGIYGSPLSDSPSKSLIAAWVGLATGPLLVLPARYLVSQRRLRGLVLSAPLLAYGINEISDLLFPLSSRDQSADGGAWRVSVAPERRTARRDHLRAPAQAVRRWIRSIVGRLFICFLIGQICPLTPRSPRCPRRFISATL
jgi:hypothetical protein